MVDRVKANLANKKKIAVILGDPRLPDKVKRDGQFNPEDFEVVEALKKALATLLDYQFIYLDNHESLYNDLKDLAGEIFLALNLCDEGYMNDPIHEDAIPIFLEQLRIPYSGANAESMRLCYNKKRVLQLALANGIPIPCTYESDKVDSYPVIVKPHWGDGGIGITAQSVVFNNFQLDEYLKVLKKMLPASEPLIQEFLPGSDLSLGIIGNPPISFEVLPITMDDYSGLPKSLPPIAGYESKWLPDSPYWKKIKTIKASLNEEVISIMISKSITLFALTGCCDYARFDWRLDAMGKPRLLEVNPNPGWCHDGHLAKMAALKGIRYSLMLVMIIKAAIRRNNLA